MRPSKGAEVIRSDSLSTDGFFIREKYPSMLGLQNNLKTTKMTNFLQMTDILPSTRNLVHRMQISYRILQAGSIISGIHVTGFISCAGLTESAPSMCLNTQVGRTESKNIHVFG